MVRLSATQREILTSLFLGEKITRLYSSISGERFYQGRDRVGALTVSSLQHRGLIKRGDARKTGILQSATDYDLTDAGRSLVEK